MFRNVLGAIVLGGLQALGPSQASAQLSPTQGPSEPAARRPQELQADPIRALDINKDGKLDAAEAKSAAAARFDDINPVLDDALTLREASPLLSEATFRETDSNRDGAVNKAEYLAHVERMFDKAGPASDGLDRAKLDTEAGRALLRLMR